MSELYKLNSSLKIIGFWCMKSWVLDQTDRPVSLHLDTGDSLALIIISQVW